jgi:DNA mismatch repair ATPase MutS
MFTLGSGSAHLGSYGIRLAKLAGFPTEVILEAQTIAKTLSLTWLGKQAEESPSTSLSFTSKKAAFQLVQKLLSLRNSSLTEDGIRTYLSSLKKTFLETTPSVIISI